MIGRCWHQPTKAAHSDHMQLEQLHHILGASVHMIPSGPESNGLRALLEAGSAETFLTGLLFIQLHANGYKVTREFSVIGRASADIAIHASTDIYIEAKQLHLKDGPKYVRNLVRDLARHAKATALGVIYVVDNTQSTSEVRFKRFGGANRRAEFGVGDFLAHFSDVFGSWYPRSVNAGLLRLFPEQGGLALYGYVVSPDVLAHTEQSD